MKERPLVLEEGAHLLDDAVRASYQPSKSEITRYAEWLGMKPGEDDYLLSIAEEGLRAPLPPCWKSCKSAEGEVFYFNTTTGESTWDHPVDAIFREKIIRAKSSPQETLEAEVKELREACKKKDLEICQLNETLAGLIDTLRACQAEVLDLSGKGGQDETANFKQELLEIKNFLYDALGKRAINE